MYKYYINYIKKKRDNFIKRALIYKGLVIKSNPLYSFQL